MIKKRTKVIMTYGSTRNVCVRLQKEENAKGGLYTSNVVMCNERTNQLLEMTNDEALKLYEILDEVVKDGNLKCTY